jgi:hypothetical protein
MASRRCSTGTPSPSTSRRASPSIGPTSPATACRGESAYTALSRGRDANRLFIADETPAREEFAPIDIERPAAVERLVRDLQRSSAESLAIDIGASAEALRLDRNGGDDARFRRRRPADRDIGIER